MNCQFDSMDQAAWQGFHTWLKLEDPADTLESVKNSTFVREGDAQIQETDFVLRTGDFPFIVRVFTDFEDSDLGWWPWKVLVQKRTISGDESYGYYFDSYDPLRLHFLRDPQISRAELLSKIRQMEAVSP